MSKNKAYYEDLFVKHLLEVGVENWCETYERGNYYYCFWLKNGEQRYWTNMSEEHLEEIKENIMENNLKKQDQQIDQLKQQLEEKDKQIDIISRDNNSYKYNIDEQKRIIDDFAKQLKEKDNYHLRYELAGADETIANLRQQLEEKDKEIERLQKVDDIWFDSYDNTIKTLKQNQTQLAIQELEKVNKYADEDFRKHCYIDAVQLEKFINQQIKELKGEKDVKD